MSKEPTLRQLVDVANTVVDKKTGLAYDTSKVAPDSSKHNLGFDSLGKYDDGLVRGINQENVRAWNQPNYKAIGNSFVQLVTGTIGDLVAAPGYAYEGAKSVGDANTDFENMFIDAGKFISELGTENFPIYTDTTSRETVFNPFDGEWVANSIAQFGPTIAMLGATYLTEGAAYPALAARLSKIPALGKYIGMAENFIQANKVAKTARMAFTSRAIEGGMEANETFTSEYAKLKQEHPEMTDEAIRLQAGNAAAGVWTKNWLLAVTDFVEFSGLVSGFGSLGKVGKFSKSLGILGIESGTEALEEGIQYAISNQAKKEAAGDKEATVMNEFFKGLGDTEMQQAMVQGALGGTVFTVIGKAMEKLKGNYKDIPTSETAKRTELTSNATLEIFNKYQKEGRISELRNSLENRKQKENIEPDVLKNIEKLEGYLDHYEKLHQSIKEKDVDVREALVQSHLKEKMIRDSIKETMLDTDTMGDEDNLAYWNEVLKNTKEDKSKVDIQNYIGKIDPETKASKLDPIKQNEAREVAKLKDLLVSELENRKLLTTKKGKEELKKKKEKEATEIKAGVIKSEIDTYKTPQDFIQGKTKYKNDPVAKNLIDTQIRELAKDERNGESRPKFNSLDDVKNYYKDKPFETLLRFGTTWNDALSTQEYKNNKPKDTPKSTSNPGEGKFYMYTNTKGESKKVKFISDSGNSVLLETEDGNKIRKNSKYFNDNISDGGVFSPTEGFDKKDSTEAPNDPPLSGDDLQAPKDLDRILTDDLENQKRVVEDIDDLEISESEETPKEAEVENKQESDELGIKTFDQAMFQFKGDSIYITNHKGGKIDLEEAKKLYIIPKNMTKGKYYTLIGLDGFPINSSYLEDIGPDYDLDVIRNIYKYKDNEVSFEIRPDNPHNVKEKDNYKKAIEIVIYVNGKRKIIGLLPSDGSTDLKRLRQQITNHYSEFSKKNPKKIFTYETTTNITRINGGTYNTHSDVSKKQRPSDVINNDVPLMFGIGYFINGSKLGATIKTNFDNSALNSEIKNFLDNSTALFSQVKAIGKHIYTYTKDAAGNIVPVKLDSKLVKTSPRLRLALLQAIASFNDAAAKSIVKFNYTNKKGKKKSIPDFNNKLADVYGNVKYDEKYLKYGAYFVSKNNKGEIVDYFVYNDGWFSSNSKFEQGNLIEADFDPKNLYLHYAYNYFQFYEMDERPLQVDHKEINIGNYNEVVANERLESDLIPGANFHSPIINISIPVEKAKDKPKKVVVKPKNDTEAKKADIEKRRKRALENTPLWLLEKGAIESKLKELKENVEYNKRSGNDDYIARSEDAVKQLEGIKTKIDKINAKYDAELKETSVDNSIEARNAEVEKRKQEELYLKPVISEGINEIGKIYAGGVQYFNISASGSEVADNLKKRGVTAEEVFAARESKGGKLYDWFNRGYKSMTGKSFEEKVSEIEKKYSEKPSTSKPILNTDSIVQINDTKRINNGVAEYKKGNDWVAYKNQESGTAKELLEKAKDNVKETPVIAETVGGEIGEKIRELLYNKTFIKGITAEGKIVEIGSGEEYESYFNTKTNKKLERVSNFIDPGDKDLSKNPLVVSSTIIGTNVDNLVRDIFALNTKSLETYNIGDSDMVDKFVEEIRKSDLYKSVLYGDLKVLAEDVIVYNDEIGVAGTLDLLFYDADGNVYIYDMKTMRGNHLKEKYKGQRETKYDTTAYGSSKRTKHTDQLSMYRILLNNTNNLKASELNILAIELDYNAGDTTTQKLKFIDTIKLDPKDKVLTAEIKGKTSGKLGLKDLMKKYNKSDFNFRTISLAKTFNLWDSDTESTWFKNTFPEQSLDILKPIDYIRKFGYNSWGATNNAGTYIMSSAQKGTLYHEAYHVAELNMFSPKESESLKKESVKSFTAPSENKLIDLQSTYPKLTREELIDLYYEEKRADAFMDYKLAKDVEYNRINELPFFKRLTEKLKKFFSDLYNYFKFTLSNRASLDSMFFKLDTGRLTPNYKRDVSKFYSKNRIKSTNFNPSLYQEIIDFSTALLADAIEQEQAITNKPLKQIVSENVLPKKNQSLLDLTDNLLFSVDKPHSVIAQILVQFETLSNQEALVEDFQKLLDSFYEVFEDGRVVYNELTFDVLRNMSSRGILINIDSSQVKSIDLGETEENVVLTDEDLDFRDAWQINFMKISPFEKQGEKLKFELNKIPVLKWINYNERKYVEEKGFLGFKKSYSPMHVYNQLQPIIGNSPTKAIMLEKLNESDNIVAKYIIDNKLQDEKFIGELFISFGQQYHPTFISLLQDDRYTRAVSSNANTILNKVTENIISTFSSLNPFYNQDGSINTEAGQKAFDDFQNFKDQVLKAVEKNKKKSSFALTDDLINSLDELLKKYNINIPKSILRQGAEEKKFIEILKGSAYGIYNFVEDFANGKDPLEKNNSGIRDTIKPIIKFFENDVQSAHKNASGGNVYEWIKANYLGKSINELKLDTSFIDFHQQDIYYQMSPLLNLIKNSHDKNVSPEDYHIDPSKIEYQIYNDIKLINDKFAKEFSNMSEKEVLQTIMIGYFNSNHHDGTAILPLPVHADSPTMTGIKIPVIQNLQYDDIRQKKGILNYLEDAAYQEFVRVKLNRSNVKNQNKYNNTFVYFDILEDPKYFKTKEQLLSYDTNKEEDQEAIRNILEGVVADQYALIFNETKDKLISLGIIEYNEGVPLFANGLMNSKDVDYFLEHFVGNFMLHQNQFGSIFNGDLTFYKNLDDYYKRAKQIWSPGTYLDVDKTRATYNVKYKDSEIITPDSPSNSYKDIETALNKLFDEKNAKELLKAFDKVDETDGQSFIDLFRYKEQQEGLWRWDERKELAYQELMRGNYNKELVDVIFNANKPFYYGKHFVDGQVIPVQNKNSEFVIIPAFAKKSNIFYNPEYKNMMEEMGYEFDVDGNVISNHESIETKRKLPDNNFIDQFAFDSAIKVGYFPGVHKYNNSDWKLQMETPLHHIDDKVIFAVQVRKHMMNDLDMEHTYTLPDGKQLTGEQWLKKYNEIIINDIKNSFEEVKSEFEDFESLINKLREEVVKRDLGDQYLEALELFTNDREELDTKLPLWHPLHLYRIEAMLNSLFTKNVSTQKLNGGVTLINVSSYGFTRKPEIKFKEDGSINYLEAYVPPYNSDILRMAKSDGTVDINEVKRKYGEKALRGIVWRIPNEDKYSTFNIKIIGFLPNASGGSIVLPPEITKIAGLDFDIDKVYGFFYSNRKKLKGDIKTQIKEFKSLLKEGIVHLKDNQDVWQQAIDSLDQASELRDKRFTDEGKTIIADFIQDEHPDTSIAAIGFLMKLSENELSKINEARYINGDNNLIKLYGDRTKEFHYASIIKSAITEYNGDVNDLMNNALRTIDYLKTLGSDVKSLQQGINKLFEPDNYENANSEKQESDNEKLDLMRAVLESPKSTKSFLTAANYDVLSQNNKNINEQKLVKRNLKKVTNEDGSAEYFEKNNSMSSVGWASVADRMNTGKTLIGVAANAQAAHAVFQHADVLKLTNGFLFNGKEYNDLTIQVNEDGKLITKVIAEPLAAFVDNGKDPQAKYSNINSYTGDIALSMAMIGIDLETIQWFLVQDVIEDFVTEYLNSGGTTESEIKLKKQYEAQYNISLAPKDVRPSNFDTQELKNGSKRNKELLRTFLFYKDISRSISNLIAATKIGENGLGPTDSDNLSRMDKLNVSNFEDIEGAERLLNRPDLFVYHLNKVIEDGRKIIIDKAKIPDRDAGAFFTLRNRIKKFKNTFNLSPKQIEFINKNYMDYLASGFEAFNFNDKLVQGLPERVVNYKLNNPDKHSLLMSRLNLDYDSKNKINYIIYTGLSGQDKRLVDRIRQDWEFMLYQGNAEERQLAQDLIQYTFMLSGFRISPQSFSHLSPVGYFIDIIPDFNNYMRDKIESAEKAFFDEEYVDMFFHQFIRNNFRSLSYVPSVDLESSEISYKVNTGELTKVNTKDKSLRSDNVFPEYIKTKYGKKDYILVKTNSKMKEGFEIAATYNSVEELGTYKKDRGLTRGKMFTHYTFGNLPSVQFKQNKLNASTDEVEIIKTQKIDPSVVINEKLDNGEIEKTDCNGL